MQQQHRLSRNRQFNYVYRKGMKTSCRELTLLYVRNSQKRVGFSVSKKVGGAVTRNLVKRRLRECVRPELAALKSGLYVIVARPVAAERSFAELRRGVEGMFHRLALYQGERPPEKPRQTP